MADLVSEGSEFSCNFCTSKLKLSVITSSSTGDAKKLANQANCFLPPPGGNCTLLPGPPPPCAGVPPGMVADTGQTTVKVDGQTALGEGCKFMCPLGQPVTLSKAGQEVAKHDEANSSVGAYVVGGCLVVAGVALAVFLLPEEVVIAGAAGTVALAKAAAKVGSKVIKKIATKAKNATKSKPKNNPQNHGASNNANAAKHKQDLRRQMEKPNVKDPDLKEIMDSNYRPNAKVGSGSTAEAIRVEKVTGETVGGKYHTQKGQDTLNALGKWIKKNQNNPNVSSGDLDAAKNVFLDIADALK